MELRESILNLNGVSAKMYSRLGTHDDVVFPEIWGGDPFYIPSYEYEVKEGYTVIDIGGHIGTYSVYAGLKGATVTTFEPMPDTFKVLKANIELNGLTKKVNINNFGLWSKEDKLNMITSEYETGSNSLLSNIFTDGGSTEVKVKEPNQFFDDKIKIDILKVDCEGAEYNIFDVLTKKNLEKVDRIVMETHLGFDKAEELLRYLQSNGFVTNMRGGLDGTARTWSIRKELNT